MPSSPMFSSAGTASRSSTMRGELQTTSKFTRKQPPRSIHHQHPPRLLLRSQGYHHHQPFIYLQPVGFHIRPLRSPTPPPKSLMPSPRSPTPPPRSPQEGGLCWTGEFPAHRPAILSLQAADGHPLWQSDVLGPGPQCHHQCPEECSTRQRLLWTLIFANVHREGCSPEPEVTVHRLVGLSQCFRQHPSWCYLRRAGYHWGPEGPHLTPAWCLKGCQHGLPHPHRPHWCRLHRLWSQARTSYITDPLQLDSGASHEGGQRSSLRQPTSPRRTWTVSLHSGLRRWCGHHE